MFAREVLPTLGALQAQALCGSVTQTFTATGTTQATAAAITTVFTNVTTGTEGQGVLLPGSMNPGDSGMVCNSTSVSIYMYPPVGYKFNGGTTNAPMMIPPQRCGRFVCIDGNNYMVA